MGSYQANPPFVPSIISRMAKHIDTLLSDTTQPLSFVVIIPVSRQHMRVFVVCHRNDVAPPAHIVQLVYPPRCFIPETKAWSKTKGFSVLAGSAFLVDRMTIAQAEHSYCEGKQVLRANRYRVASFDTAVFFLQNGVRLG